MEAIADVRGAAFKNSATRWTAPIRSLGFTKGAYHLQKVDERHEEGPGLPSNWRDLEATKVGTVLELMTATGLGLVWVPRQAVLLELLQAPVDEVYGLILVHEKTILDDVKHALTEVVAHELQDIRNAAEAALLAYRGKHHSAAQALAAAALTDAIEVHLATSLSKLRRQYEEVNVLEGPLEGLRLLSLLVAMARSVLTQFDRADSIPPTFNRHASLHTVALRQYTRRNALAALLLLGAVVREMQEWEPHGDAQGLLSPET
jgi:hypothetical protein